MKTTDKVKLIRRKVDELKPLWHEFKKELLYLAYQLVKVAAFIYLVRYYFTH